MRSDTIFMTNLSQRKFSKLFDRLKVKRFTLYSQLFLLKYWSEGHEMVIIAAKKLKFVF